MGVGPRSRTVRRFARGKATALASRQLHDRGRRGISPLARLGSGAELNVTLNGRHVLVTGARGGIGSAIVRVVREAGATVFETDAAEAEGVHRCDVSSESDVAAAFDEAARETPLTDVVHAAGICATSPVAELELAEWNRILEVNLTGSFLVGRAAARALPDDGTIVFIASV